VQPVFISGVTPTTHCASVELPRPCCTSLTAAWNTSSKVVSLPFTQHLILRWSGCATAAYAKERHGADTWTILKADGKRLQAFHMQCQCHILGIHWSDFVTNATAAEKTGLPDIWAVIGNRRLALFGHVRRLSEGTPAHDALQASVELSSGTNNITWRRKPGRPPNSWLRGVLKDIPLTVQEAWTAVDDREAWRVQQSTVDYAF